jgi:hypothetical protein
MQSKGDRMPIYLRLKKDLIKKADEIVKEIKTKRKNYCRNDFISESIEEKIGRNL